MNKIIYSLKMYIFQDQYHLTAEEKNSLKRFCEFAIMSYIRFWFTANYAVKAPNSDLKLLKTLAARAEDGMYKAAANKLLRHLWYLSAELVGLAFFDEDVSVTTKRKMVANLAQRPSTTERRVSVSFEDIETLELEDFVNQDTKLLLEKFDIHIDFLKEDPTKWHCNEHFVNGKEKLCKTSVVNDAAERAVALMTDFNDVVTKNEEQKQFLLQVVEQSRKNDRLQNKNF